MPRIIDLSVPLGGPRLSLVPGHPPVLKESLHSHDRQGRSNTKISFSIHTATHVDAPYHFDRYGQTIDQVPLERLMGPGVRLDLRSAARARCPLSVADLQACGAEGLELKGTILVLYTGWMDAAYGKPHFYRENPYYATEAARWLAERGPRALAVDHPVDRAETAEPHPGDFPVHRIFLERGVPLIENLANLGLLPERGFQIIALPLKIYRGDGAPARVIALVE